MNPEHDDIARCEDERRPENFRLRDATDATTKRAGRKLPAYELKALWCEHWR